MKRKSWLVFSFSFALAGAITLQACGKTMSRVAPLRGLDSGAPATVIPAGKSVTQVAPALIGTYSHTRSGCRAPDDSFVPVLSENDASTWVIQISDQQVVSQSFYDSGCEVTLTYRLLGIDSQTIAIGNRVASVTLNGNPDYTGACSNKVSPDTGARSYSYRVSGGDFSLLGPATSPCEDPEKNEEGFQKN